VASWLRHCDLNDLISSRTAVESNRNRIIVVTITALTLFII